MLTRDDTGINISDNNANKYCCDQCLNIICCQTQSNNNAHSKPLNNPNNDNETNNLPYLGKERSTICLKISFFLIGVGFLFPYNSVVTAVDFFASIYFKSIDFELGWFLLLPSMIILCITLKFGYWGTIYQRIIGTFLLQAILTIIIPLVRNVYILFISTFILGCLSAILQGTIFSVLGFLGPDMMGITQTGVGCSGVVVGIVRICTKIWIPTDIKYSTYLYFLLAFIMVIMDIMLYIILLHPSKRVQKAIYEDSMKNQSLHELKQEKKITKISIKFINEI